MPPLLLGRGETQPPAELDRSPVELPEGRTVTAEDVRALRISVVFRGYRMTEVDWLLDQFALILDERDAEIAALTALLHPGGRRRGERERRRPSRARPTTRSPRMPDLVERIDVDAPPERVWALLTDWERQGEWMLLTDVRTVGGPAQRLHGRLAARTGLPLPGGRRLGVLDTMIITKWEPPRLVEVQHTGRIVRGPGHVRGAAPRRALDGGLHRGLVPAVRVPGRGRLVPRPAPGRPGAPDVAASDSPPWPHAAGRRRRTRTTVGDDDRVTAGARGVEEQA